MSNTTRKSSIERHDSSEDVSVSTGGPQGSKQSAPKKEEITRANSSYSSYGFGLLDSTIGTLKRTFTTPNVQQPQASNNGDESGMFGSLGNMFFTKSVPTPNNQSNNESNSGPGLFTRMASLASSTMNLFGTIEPNNNNNNNNNVSGANQGVSPQLPSDPTTTPDLEQAWDELRSNPKAFLKRHELSTKYATWKEGDITNPQFAVETDPIGLRKDKKGNLHPVHRFHLMTGKGFEVKKGRIIPPNELQGIPVNTGFIPMTQVDPFNKQSPNAVQVRENTLPTYDNTGSPESSHFFTPNLSDCSVVRKNRALSHWQPGKGKSDVMNPGQGGRELEKRLDAAYGSGNVFGPSTYQNQKTNLTRSYTGSTPVFIRSGGRGQVDIFTQQSGYDDRGYWDSSVRTKHFAPFLPSHTTDDLTNQRNESSGGGTRTRSHSTGDLLGPQAYTGPRPPHSRPHAPVMSGGGGGSGGDQANQLEPFSPPRRNSLTPTKLSPLVPTVPKEQARRASVGDLRPITSPAPHRPQVDGDNTANTQAQQQGATQPPQRGRSNSLTTFPNLGDNQTSSNAQGSQRRNSFSGPVKP